MALKLPERSQAILFPPSVEDMVESDAPVRVYDAMIDAFDFPELGIIVDHNKVGSPQYDPRSMLKLLVYGYSYGFRSSRKLELATHHNISFIWLMGNLKPDHKTIAEFRRKNKKALSKVLQEVARFCVRLNLIEGNTLFVDGSKIRANASIDNSWSKDRCQKKLEKIDKRIAEIIAECEAADEHEAACGSFVKVPDELADQESLRAKVQSILADIQQQQRPSVNTTDNDCTKIHSRQGNHAGYNGQSVVDEKHGLIVSCDVVNESNDIHQFAYQINRANEVLDKKCKAACGDSGYGNIDELEKVDAQGIEVIVPSQRQASNQAVKPFDVRNFKYDRENDCYICPKGNILPYKNTEYKKNRKVYLAGKAACFECEHFGKCTTNRLHGRKVTRLLKEDLRQEFERRYMLAENQEIYKLRKQKVELPFGHIKYNLGVSGFLLRGLAGVKAEFSIMTSCFNITRMIRLLGSEKLVEILKAVAQSANNAVSSKEITPLKQNYAKNTLEILRYGEIYKKNNLPQILAAA